MKDKKETAKTIRKKLNRPGTPEKLNQKGNILKILPIM